MGLNLDIDTVVFSGLGEVRRRRPARPDAGGGRPDRRPGRAPRARRQFSPPRPSSDPFDPRLVEAVETHRFAPLTAAALAQDGLNSSPLRCSVSLDRPPPDRCLVRDAPADDAPRWRPLTRDGDGAGPRARGGAAAVGGLPGPRFQTPHRAHAHLLSPVFRHLRGPGGRIPEDFLIAHVPRSRPHRGRGGRAADARPIRTWTYLSHRAPGWPTRAMAGTGAGSRGPALGRAPRAADPGLRRPVGHGDRPLRGRPPGDDDRRRRRGAGAGPARGHARGLPLPA